MNFHTTYRFGRITSALLLLLVASTCIAQEDSTLQGKKDEAFFRSLNLDSLCELKEQNLYCVEVDGNQAIDPGNPYLDFEWEFEPDVRKKGIVVEHCYDTPGYKTIWLNVYDTRTKTLKRHDTAISVYCPPQLIPFEHEGGGQIKSFIRFKVPTEIANSVEGTFLWQFGEDGPVRRGRSVLQPFSRQGKYRVILLHLDESGIRPEVLSAYCEELVVRGINATIIPK